MKDVGYPDLALHRERHEAFVRDVHVLQELLERDGATPKSLSAMVDAVQAWVTEHVWGLDRELAEFIRTRGQHPAMVVSGGSSRGN